MLMLIQPQLLGEGSFNIAFKAVIRFAPARVQ